MRIPRILLPVLAGVVLAGFGLRSDIPTVQANDNRLSAGRLAGDSLRISLEIRNARWHPEAEDGPAIDVAVFGEAGKPPQIPGPMIRVKTGTTVIATLRNGLSDSDVTVHGFVTRPAFPGPGIHLKPGESRTVRFAVGAPGTYFYSADVGVKDTAKFEREQLAGAFIVDSAGAAVPDRVFVINIWGETVDSLNYRNALAINGKSWPYTERLNAAVGDSIHWRVINASIRPHPMHLHGVYYRVDSKGTNLVDTTYHELVRRLVVTETMWPEQTMTMSWRPDRPGNWLFHCHLMFHAMGTASLNEKAHDFHSSDALQHMAGLVLGITATTRGSEPEISRANARELRLHVLQGPQRGRSQHAMSFVLEREGKAPASDSVENPGSLLVLTRGEPTDITVLNHMPEGTAVHWHGIELESWSDGVAGWSSMGDRRAPVIAPGDSFVARLTLPRAGTFIYHTHLNDIEQVTSGLYGPIVVLEPGQRFDPETDHVFVVSWSGPEDPPKFLVNGDSLPKTMRLKGGVTHRFRFINIGPAGLLQFTMRRDSTVQSWRPIAKDGAQLPTFQAHMGRAVVLPNVGETYDVEWTPSPGEYTLGTGSRRFGSGPALRIIVE
jgi:FtsP/CotA-like multicopper oxidase with cupredoxin domain